MDFEFLNNNEETPVKTAERSEVQSEYSEIAYGLICTYKSVKKLTKKRKKAKKALLKQGKRIKKLSSWGKEVGKNVEVLSEEIDALKRDVAKFKKTARDNLFKELVYCDDISERKRLIAEIQSTEATL